MTEEKGEPTLITNQKMSHTSRNDFADLQFRTRYSVTNQQQKFFCPFCEHCNNLKDDTLDKFISYTYESKSILNKGFEYILNSGLLKTKSEIFAEAEINNTKRQEEFYYEEPENNKKNKVVFDIEVNC